jgi:hypothetical protein
MPRLRVKQFLVPVGDDNNKVFDLVQFIFVAVFQNQDRFQLLLKKNDERYGFSLQADNLRGSSGSCV